MTRRRQAINPFYPLLVIAGIAFAITACAYGLMALRAIHPQLEGEDTSGNRLLEFLNQHGLILMVVELLVLAVMSLLAMSTDRYWSNRSDTHDEDANTSIR